MRSLSFPSSEETPTPSSLPELTIKLSDGTSMRLRYQSPDARLPELVISARSPQSALAWLFDHPMAITFNAAAGAALQKSVASLLQTLQELLIPIILES